MSNTAASGPPSATASPGSVRITTVAPAILIDPHGPGSKNATARASTGTSVCPSSGDTRSSSEQASPAYASEEEEANVRNTDAIKRKRMRRELQHSHQSKRLALAVSPNIIAV